MKTKNSSATNSRTLSQTNNYYSNSNFFESNTNTMQNRSNNDYNKNHMNTGITLKCSSSLNRNSSSRNRIRRKIDHLNEELLLHHKIPSRINSPPYESRKKNKIDDLQELISAMSPLQKKKKNHNCLLDIIGKSKPNIKVIKELKFESKNDLNKKIDEVELHLFMNKLISPSMKKLVITKNINTANIGD